VYAIPIQEAQAILNAISVRQMPPVWDVHGKKRILRNGLDYKSKTLLLLYSEPENATVPIDELLEWTSYSNPTMYRTTVLRPLHADGLIEYDEQRENVTLSPLGIRKTEEDLLYPLN
jgi:hypothetical protein